jgi:hypothetical protein
MVVVIKPSRVGAKTLFSFGDLADSTENIAPDGMEQAADVGAPVSGRILVLRWVR